MIKHGEMKRGKHSPEAKIWVAMLQRCHNPSCKSYPDYGGRGIKVCSRWTGPDGLIHFLEDMGRRPDGCSLDRINNDGGYCPENCRWATRKEQQRNRRANVYVTINGETRCLTEWAERLSISIRTVFKRVHKLGWEPSRALLEPSVVGRRGNPITVGDETLTAKEWSARTGVPVSIIRERISSGWGAEQAVFTKPKPNCRRSET